MRFIRDVIFIQVIFILMTTHAAAQCSGGALAGNIVPGAAWSSAGTANVAGGTYFTFTAAVGNTYFFSFCPADGGSSVYDTQLTILNNTGGFAGGYSDDYCGLQSNITWNCTIAGVYRVLVNKFNCNTQANMGTLVYKFQGPLSCPGNLGAGVTNVASLPYSSGAGTTCGNGNDLSTANLITCGSTLYQGGNDNVWIFTPAITGTVSINLFSTGTYTSLVLYHGCPLTGQGGTCVDFAQSPTGNKTLTVCLTAGNTYYLILDSWPAPACNPYSNLTISAPVPAGGCALGTGQVNVPSLPYSSTGRTTCGKGDDITSINSVTCGSVSYFTAEDEVFVFTPAVSGTSTISLTSNSSWVGMMLYNGCPLVTSCSGIPGSCIAFEQSSAGSQSMCVALVGGTTYYLVVDQFASPYCIPSYSINITAPSGAFTGTTCGNAYPVSALPFSLAGESTTCMINNYTNATSGSCGTLYESGEDKVYSYTATVGQCIGITLTGASNNNIGYQVYQGCPGAGGICIASNGGANSGVLTGSAVLPGAGTYYIIVDSWAPPNSVSYNISVISYGNGPANDLPCNATVLPLGINSTGNNSCSGFAGEPSAPTCWITPNVRNTVWYAVTAPASGQLRIRTAPGSLLNTHLALYSGTCGAVMTQVACNDDAPPCGSTITNLSEISVTGLVSGNTYYICVDGYSGLTGSFGIMAIDGMQAFPPAAGQECLVPNPVCNSNIIVGDPGYQVFGNRCDFPGGGGNCLLTGERGSAWYEIQIAAAGILEFNIIPNDWPGAPSLTSTDYDFAVWKMAGTGSVTCAAIAAGASPLRCNYSALGVTGCYSAAPAVAPAAYPGYGAAYDANIAVVAGEIYYLVVSNFSNSTSGFSLNISPVSPVNYTPSPATVVWSGGVDNDWFKAPNWGGCAIPTCNINAIISPSASNQPIINAAGAACKSITVNPSASLTINATYTLNVCGDYLNNGTLTAATTSTVLFSNGNINQNIDGNLIGASSFGNVTVTKTGGLVDMKQDADMKGNFSITTATGNVNTNSRYNRVGGNFTSSGTYTAGSGTLELNGSAPQAFTCGSVLNNVIMQHTGTGVTLGSNMLLGTGGTLTLNSGNIITMPLYEVSVANRAPGSVTPGSATSYVQGFLRRYINATGSYDFPVGESIKGYQRANVNFITSTLIDNLRAEFRQYPVLPPGIGGAECGVSYTSNALDNGKWSITASNDPTSGNYNMTLYNRAGTYTNAASGWTIMKDAGAGWGLWNGACMISPVTAVVRNNMNGFSDFGTAQAPLPLPVELLTFTGQPLDASILLSWATAAEINNKGFELQRATSPPEYKSISWTEGHGNSSKINDYEYEDRDVDTGIRYYYRLKQVDFNSDYKYSPVITAIIQAKNNFSWNVQPNPFAGKTSITYSITRPAIVMVEVLNSTGQVISTLAKGWQQAGSYQLYFSATRLGYPAGVYTLRMVVGEEIHTTKLVEME